EDSEVQDTEQSQQYPHGSRSAVNSAELWATDSEEEPRDSDEYVTDEASLQSKLMAACSVSASVLYNTRPSASLLCVICMSCYSQIVQSGRLVVATMCGHIFCSECLPVALETTGMCPTCRMELTSDLYFPIYL
ncbi:RNF4 ligase, partial [Hirundo rustica]|nr:RNF4 ligase [Hirundo rustica]